MIIIPLTSDGARRFSVTTSAGVLSFRTCRDSLDAKWLCDIADGNGTSIATGLALVAGTPNLLQGLGNDQLDGYALEVVTNGYPDSERYDGTWGNGAVLILREPGTPAALTLPDPLAVAVFPVDLAGGA